MKITPFEDLECWKAVVPTFHSTRSHKAPKRSQLYDNKAQIVYIHSVTAGRCAEKGKKLIGNDEGIWDILGKRS